ncbi:hypothetical protein Hanom_Chr11g01049581 [Helianthus anomalus]
MPSKIRYYRNRVIISLLILMLVINTRKIIQPLLPDVTPIIFLSARKQKTKKNLREGRKRATSAVIKDGFDFFNRRQFSSLFLQ